MKLAVISDIHGNSWALEAVLEDISKHDPDLVVNLGDALYGPLKPGETFNLIKSNNILSISGNEDRLILEKNPPSLTLDFVIRDLSPEAMKWLESLPETMILSSGIFMCHGTTDCDTTYLLEDICEGNLRVRNPEDLEELLNGVNEKIILCGHSHLPRLVNTSEKIIINPGSVGCPAFDDDHPCYHKVSNYSYHARYCMVELYDKEIITHHIAVSYDHMKAADCAIRNGRSDWAKWLQSGRAQ